jgi:hypothetical protein
LKKIEYVSSGQPGIYRSGNRLTEAIPLLSLNELSDKPHNAFSNFLPAAEK